MKDLRAVLAQACFDLESSLQDSCDTCGRLFPFDAFPATHRDIRGIPCHGNKSEAPYICNGGVRLSYAGPLYDPRDLLTLLREGKKETA